MTLAFRLGRIPVRVEPAFWFMALILGGGSLRNPMSIVVWIAVVFVSVLLHELGHAVSGIAFGLEPAISLHGFGGTTSWRRKDVSRLQQVIISVAGPLVGIVIGGSIWLAYALDAMPPLSPSVREATAIAVYANLWWGALNLLPILPLDGGNVVAQLVRERPARFVSIAVGTPLAVLALVTGNLWGALLAGMMVVQNGRALFAARQSTSAPAAAPPLSPPLSPPPSPPPPERPRW